MFIDIYPHIKFPDAASNLMNKWSDLKLDRRNLIENLEKEISSEEIVNTLIRPQTSPGNKVIKKRF